MDWKKQMEEEAKELRKEDKEKRMEENKPKDGAYLYYVKAGLLYPVIMTESQYEMLQLFAHAFNPLQLAPFPQEAMTWQEMKKRGMN